MTPLRFVAAALQRMVDRIDPQAGRYRMLFESSPLPMWVLDAETLRFVSVNETRCRLTGHTRGELIGQHFGHVTDPEILRHDLDLFARQVEALARPGDLLIIHSTSGNSPNVLRAAEAAKARRVPVLAFSARDGGGLRALADHSVVIPTTRTDRAQELHLCIEHIICDLVEQTL